VGWGAKVEGWVAKVEGWVARVEGWVDIRYTLKVAVMESIYASCIALIKLQ
jgi:hypothetical protein